MGLLAYAEAIWDETVNVIKHPINATVAFGDRTIGLIYYATHTAINSGAMGEDAEIGSEMAAKRIYSILTYCLHHQKEFAQYYAAYKKAYPGFQGGWDLSESITSKIIFKGGAKAKKGLDELNYFIQYAIRKEISITTGQMAIFGALIRADISGKLCRNHQKCLKQVAYIILTGESNLYMFKDIKPNPNVKGSNKLTLELYTLKMISYVKK